MAFDLIKISPDLLDPLTKTYASVFAGPKWFEVEKCRHCGRAYPGPGAARPAADASYAPGIPCWNPNCGRPLELMSFYNDPEERLAEKIITNAMAQAAFAGFAAREAGAGLIGFSWGYRLPSVDTPSVQFSAAHAWLADLGLDPATTFYAAEIGVVPERQRRGVAQQLAAARFRAAIAGGFSQVCFRTVDREGLVGLYEAMFGKGRVRELFGDPDPAKSQIWFAVDLADLTPDRE